MSDKKMKDKQSEVDVDIFNMQSASKLQMSDGTEGEKSDVTPLKSGINVDALRPGHFVAVAIVLAAIWIGWPYLVDRAPSDPLTGKPTRMLAPTAAIAMEQANRSDRSSSTTAQGSSAPRAEESKLEALVDELSMQVVAMQSELVVAKAEAEKCLAPPALIPARRKTRRRTPVTDVAERQGMNQTPLRFTDKTSKPSDFTLNTIYREQAWIQRAERTYLVQAGDNVDGLRIIRIEPVARSVVTSHGLIR